MSETQRIRSELQSGHPKWGFMIYRCTHDSFTDSTRCMAILNAHAAHALAYEGAQDMLNSLGWAVQEDPTLEEASKDEIRRYETERAFSPTPSSKVPILTSHVPVTPASQPSYLAANPASANNSPSLRRRYCTSIDEASLPSVLAGPWPPDIDLYNTTFVDLTKLDWAPLDLETFDWEAVGKDPARGDFADEGRRRWRVAGSMMLGG